MIIPAPVTLRPHSSDLEQQLVGLSSLAGIYLLKADERPIHLSWSAHLGRRLKRLLVPSYTAHTGPLSILRDRITHLEFWLTGSRLETSLLLAALARLHYPDDYLRRLRLRFPWFVGFTSNDPYPRLTLTNRIHRRSGALYGPFHTRDAAQRYQEELIGLFQIRRCTETLEPHPEHPGCIYGEMNLCMRPCQCAVSEQEYASETQRVNDFLASNGRHTLATLSSTRDRACEATDFEQAALVHKQIDRIKAVIALREDVIGEAQIMNGVALTPGLGRRQLKLWPMCTGYWQDPVVLDFSREVAPAKSLDHELRERLASALASSQTNGERSEDLALFSRWYHSSWRDGHWFSFQSLDRLNYRRLVREISKLLASS